MWKGIWACCRNICQPSHSLELLQLWDVPPPSYQRQDSNSIGISIYDDISPNLCLYYFFCSSRGPRSNLRFGIDSTTFVSYDFYLPGRCWDLLLVKATLVITHQVQKINNGCGLLVACMPLFLYPSAAMFPGLGNHQVPLGCLHGSHLRR